MTLKSKIIAMDGPAGAGKSTIAKKVSKLLGYEYIDTGAMYRAITLKFIRENVDLEDLKKIEDILNHTSITFTQGSILLDGSVVDLEIRSVEVNAFVSPVSAIEIVRKKLVEIQRNIAADKNVVLDGRDIGTVVFPNADYKFYLDATVEERAKRRYNEVKDNLNTSLEEIMQSIANRDKIDSNRLIAPLKKAEDAIYLDTTKMNIEEVVQGIIGEIQ